MQTLAMPLPRKNRLALLMLLAGIVGSAATLFSYGTSVDGPALPSAAQSAKERDLCLLADKLADAADPSIRETGASLRKANGCAKR